MLKNAFFVNVQKITGHHSSESIRLQRFYTFVIKFHFIIQQFLMVRGAILMYGVVQIRKISLCGIKTF